jgi:uncharacterized membrane protein YjgN (DUF898 family)
MSTFDAAGLWPTKAPKVALRAQIFGSSAPMAPGTQPVKLFFSGQGSEFTRLCLRAGLFTVLTLGLYRFWFLTDTRRLLWRHTRVGNDSLEYRGTGKELLLGFLFALAILAPLYLGYFLLGIEAERYRAFASAPFVLLLMLFGVWASYRARRYRLTRTVFRGARFWMKGSGFIYLLRYLAWGLATLLTLGLAYPWMAASLERYKMGNTFYGDLQGSFEGQGWTFFKRGALLWLLSVPPSVAVAVTTLSAMSGVPGHANVVVAPIGGFASLFIPLALIFVLVMKGIEWRWWAEGLRFGQVRVTSTLRAWFLFNEYFKLIMSVLAVLIMAIVFVGLAAYLGQHIAGPLPPLNIGTLASVAHQPPIIHVIALVLLIAYLAMFIAVGTIYRRFLVFGVWRKVIASLTLHDGQVFDNVKVAGPASSPVGEALADALDFGF